MATDEILRCGREGAEHHCPFAIDFGGSPKQLEAWIAQFFKKLKDHNPALTNIDLAHILSDVWRRVMDAE